MRTTKKNLFNVIFCLFCAIVFCSCENSKVKTLLDPECDSISDNKLSVDKVIITDSMTIVDFSYQFEEANYIYISQNSFLKAGDKTFKLIGTKNIYTTQEHAEQIHWRNFTFSLIFEPIPFDTKNVDFFENEDLSGWSIRNIHLDSSELTCKYDGLGKSKEYENKVIESQETETYDYHSDYNRNSSSYSAPDPEYIYCCVVCHSIVNAPKSKEPRPNSGQCTGGYHLWTNYGKVGNSLFECSECGVQIRTESRPLNTNGCPINRGGQHRWVQRY